MTKFDNAGDFDNAIRRDLSLRFGATKAGVLRSLGKILIIICCRNLSPNISPKFLFVIQI
jgi:hypothetical protein